MSGFENAAQQIVFNALDGALSCDVYDDVPFLPEGAPHDAFPYVVIGNDTARAWDTDDTLGADTTLTLHVWSRAPGFKECKTIMGQIYDLLNRADLTGAGHRVVDCLFDFSETMLDGDGETRHGVARYRMIIEATS